jgi:pilus assembly protein Flp/PilA
MLKQTLEYYNAKFGINQEGATAVEYGLMVALIAVAIILAVTLLGTNLTARFNEVASKIGPGGS